MCESPTITLSSASVPAGGAVTVKVEGAYSECNDQGEGAAPPIESVDLELRSGGQTFDLGSAPADSDGDASLEAVLPADVPAGAATIVATNVPDADEAQVTVTE